jgi:hypothetical protein
MTRAKRAPALLLVLLAAVLLTSCAPGTELTKAEEAAAQRLVGGDAALEEVALPEGVQPKDVSVKKIRVTADGRYLFFASPVGYNGPIDLLLVIDGKTGETSALSILDHQETEHYVRDFENEWFTARFVGQNAAVYLEAARLEAGRSNEIVAITGSTITTDGVIDGVNDCFTVFRALDNPFFEEKDGTIEVVSPSSGTLGTFTADDLKGLERYRRSLTIHSSGGDTAHDFRGVRLSDLLALADPQFAERYGSAVAIGTDGYGSVLTMAEILLENNAFVMDEDGGLPITGPSGEKGAFRLVILGDQYGQRFTNLLCRIELIEA